MAASLQKNFLAVDEHKPERARLASVQSFGLTGATA